MSVDVVVQEVAEPVLGDRIGPVDYQVEETRVVSDIHQHIGKEPVVVLRVVGHISAKVERALAEASPQRELVLNCRDRLVDMPLATGRDQAVWSIEGKLSAGWVIVIGEEVLTRTAGWFPQPARPGRSGDVVGCREHLERQQGVPLLGVVHDLGGVLQVPLLAEVERHRRGKPGGHRPKPVIQGQRQIARRGRHPLIQPFRRIHRDIIAEAGDILRVGCVGEGKIEDELVPVIEVLDRDPDVPVVKIPGHARLELTSRNAREARIAHTVIVPIKSPDIEAPIVADGPVHVEVIAGQALVAPLAVMVPPKTSPPLLLMKFTMAPGVLDPNSGELPPRTTSIRSMLLSKRNRLSAFMKKVCIVGNTGSPSSRNATYSTPRMPRMLMFSLTSPPELSTRVNPGTTRSISVVLLGAAAVISVAVSVVTATLASRFTRGLWVPVTTRVCS